MTNILQYSVLRYSPSIVSGESINLGVLVADGDYAEFFHTIRFSRVHEFGDTLNIDTVRVLLDAISDEVKGDLTVTGNDRRFYHFPPTSLGIVRIFIILCVKSFFKCLI